MTPTTKNIRKSATTRNQVKKRRPRSRKERIRPEPIKPVSQPSPPPDMKVQQNLLAVLCCKDAEAGKLVLERINPALFEGDYRVIAERVYGYRKKYKKAPGKAHLIDLFPDIMDGKNARSDTYFQIIDDMVQLAEHSNFNVAFVRDQLDQFQRAQSLKSRVLKAAELAHAGRTDEAEEVLSTAHLPIKNGRALTSRSMDKFEPTETEWLWWPFVPRGELTTFFGAGDVGKSSLTIYMSVKIAKGQTGPQFGNDEPDNAPRGSTLFITRENDPASVIRPRLEAAGADEAALRKVHYIGYEDPEDNKTFESVHALDTQMEALEKLIAEIGDVKLVVIDPAPDFIGKVDNNSSEQIRQKIIAPLLHIARKYDLAVIFVLHVNKKEDATARNRAVGSEAWINGPRSGVVIGKNPDDPSQHVVVLTKHNLAPGASGAVTFYMESVGRAHRIKFEREYIDMTAEQLLAQKKGGASKLDKAKELLKTRLTDGPMRVEELVTEAEASGISERTLRSAKKQLNIRSKKDGLTGWLWLFRRKKD